MSKTVSPRANIEGVAYIITSLAMGGAQKVLLGLLDSQQLKAKPPLVISLLKTEGLQAAFASAGTEVFYVELEKPQLFLKKIIQLRRLIAERQIRVIYSFLHHANLFALFIASLSQKPRPLVIWGLHDTPLKNLYTRWQHRLLFWLTVRLAPIPRKIILVSERSRKRYVEVGYPADTMQLIPNGVLVKPLDPDQTEADRQALRAELGLSSAAVVLGSLTRAVPEKDLPLMLDAFAQLVAQQDAYLVLVGEGVDLQNTALQAQITSLCLQDRVYTLGIRQDAPRLIRAFDIATLSSRSEALPLFLVEAMALGIPCVATDVGDVGLVLGGQGELVAAGDSQALAVAWKRVLNYSVAEKQMNIQTAWQHIQANFSVERMQQQHLAVFAEVLQSCEANQAWNMRIHHKRC
ncbi:glycosyltransferase [uncultured Thiothrix sp.]|uniref:glycosyltransferase n=1 Tax=uncultured Thiothrix sp. TaxID=223185 RepID=UPI002630D402|nr:glycosyltransferase [uncultured Thiothrix sp.]